MRAFAMCLMSLPVLMGVASEARSQPDLEGSRVQPAMAARQVQFTETVPLPTQEATPEAGPAFSDGGESRVPLWSDGISAGFDATAMGPISDPLSDHAFDLSVAGPLVDEAEVYSTNNWFRGGRWYCQQEFVMLLRTALPTTYISVDPARTVVDTAADGQPPNFVPVVVSNSVFLRPTLNTTKSSFTYEPGTRLSLGRIFGRDVANRDHGIEFSFLGLFDFTGQSTIRPSNPDVGNSQVTFLGAGRLESLLGSLEVTNVLGAGTANGLGFPFIAPVPGFSNAVFQSILYEANLNSFESNYRIGGRPVRDRLVMQPDGRWVRFATPSHIQALFAGVRYVRMNERLEHRSRGGLTFGRPNEQRGFYTVGTDNDLVGIQLGAELTEKRTDWMMGLRGKVGGLVNFSDRQSRVDTLIDDDQDENTPLVASSRGETLNDQTVTFLSEASVYAAYYLRPNTSFRVGYDVLFMNGVAVASENFGLLPEFPKFDLNGLALYHGLSMGFEMTW